MSQIWSISLTASSVGACALALNADFRAHHEQLETDATIPFACSAQSLFSALERCFQFLAQDGELPLLICLCSCTTACIVDKYGCPLTPIYSELPLTIPRRDVPSIFVDDPALFATYRTSLLRRLQQSSPLLGQTSAVGLSTAAALVIRALTGAHLDVHTPLGTLESYPWTSHEAERLMLFKALGVSEPLSCRRARAGSIIATISKDEIIHEYAAPITKWCTKLSGIPVMHMGSVAAASAYASAANPLSWACTLGWTASAQWTASKSAFSAYEILVQDKPATNSDPPTIQTHQPKVDERGGSGVFADRQIDAQGETSPSQIKKHPPYDRPSEATQDASQHTDQKDKPAPTERTRDDWTHMLIQKLETQTEPGARRNDACAIIQTPSYQTCILQNALKTLQNAFDHHADDAPWFAEDMLARAPVGSQGLHFLPLKTDIALFGLTNAHTEAHIVRAAFESQAYAIQRWRRQTEIRGLGPIRAIFSAPWDLSCAQILCDILGEPIIVIDAHEAEHAALGAAVAAARDYEILPKSASPHLTAWQLEPDTRVASVYDTHARIHAALLEPLD